MIYAKNELLLGEEIIYIDKDWFFTRMKGFVYAYLKTYDISFERVYKALFYNHMPLIVSNGSRDSRVLWQGCDIIINDSDVPELMTSYREALDLVCKFFTRKGNEEILKSICNQ